MRLYEMAPYMMVLQTAQQKTMSNILLRGSTVKFSYATAGTTSSMVDTIVVDVEHDAAAVNDGAVDDDGGGGALHDGSLDDATLHYAALDDAALFIRC